MFVLLSILESFLPFANHIEVDVSKSNNHKLQFNMLFFYISPISQQQQKIVCVKKAPKVSQKDLWFPFMSAPQIIIYLFLIYAITLSIKLCKIDINLSRCEHVHIYVKTAQFDAIMNGKLTHHRRCEWCF